MIVSDDRSSGVILEVNTRPGLGGHLFPGKGEARDFAKAIIDYYFPETKNDHRSNLYFDFDSVIEAVTSRSVENIDIISPPKKPLIGKEYVIKVDQELFSNVRRYVRRQALIFEMHGYAET